MTPRPAHCQQARFCRCGREDCPGAPRSRARALVQYARWRNHAAIRLRRSRDRWASEQRELALSARDSLIAQARHLLGGAS